ncbi:hypothetical protein HS041_12350 [Planomonospora sp. ID67723]|uniref:hypothetical protein n=1 Tax=Planomonospora sp. ID67723 TaxID=2738134 RepID=UPI0018C43F10|nr:hypothetical protein [Planomonospora sp. ID67723]MBG0828560.1 hypothetical protein [Planomonospora sp. ID67723]
MLRNADNREGGPGDPKTVREWWTHFKGWPAKILILCVAVILLAGLYTVLTQAIR